MESYKDQEIAIEPEDSKIDTGIDVLPAEEQLLEDIRETDILRRWNYINFCKRLRKMRSVFS